MANKVNTTYSANLGTSNVKVQPTQAITPTTVDTSYQGNSNALYGGHDATWWQNQYARQTDAESQAMVRKAADYYGYKIPETVAQPQTTAQTLNSSNSNVASYAEYSQTTPTQNNVQPTAQATTYAANTNQEQVAATTPTSQTTQTEAVDSYEEFLRKRAEGYQETLDKTNQAIEENKQTAIDQAELQRLEAQRQAEVTREREIADSRSSYEQNKATYGTNAEQMADMGLAGSGYSDYINSQAYATQRAEQQTANADADTAKQNAQYTADQAKLAAVQQANSDKLNAELNYAENMANNDAAIAQYRQQKEEEAKAKAEQEEAERKAYYAELLGYANNGSYTQEQLAQLGAQYGLSEEQLKSLDDAALTYKDNTYKQNYAEALDNITNYGADLDASYLDNMLKMDLITQEQYNDLKNQLNTKLTDEIKQNVTNGDSAAIQASIDNADKYYSEGKITQEQYQSVYNDYVGSAVGGVSNVDDYQSVKKTLDEYKNSGKLSQAQYDNLLSKMKKNTTKKLDSSQYKVSGLSTALDKTDDIDVKINGVTYDLVSGSRVKKDSTKSLLNEVATGNSGTAPSVGTIVVVCGKMYIYKKYGAFGINAKARWYEMGNDRSKVSDAVKAYMNQ